MKKRLAILLLMLICFDTAVSALAEAKLSAVQKNLITFEGEWKGYFFAKIENTGDSASYTEYGGKLVAFDEDDNIILTENYASTSPLKVFLEPNEYAYIRTTVLENNLENATVTDYKFSIKPEDNGYLYHKIPCEAKLEYGGSQSSDNYIHVTFTNESNEILDRFYVVAALFDQNEKLVFVNSYNTSVVGIHPQSTVTTKIYIDHELVEYYAIEGINPTTIDALVYIPK